MVGAAGAGASAAALLAHHAGAVVSGCDPGGPGPYTSAVEAAGIELAWAHDAAHVADASAPRVERLAVTKALTSVQPDHPELEAARRNEIPVEPWQQLIADAALSQGGRLIAVAGTHGKSTTTGWLVHLLTAAGMDPAAFVGALLDPQVTGGPPATARWGRGAAFVVEADEYAGNFDPYRPHIAVLLNAEWDHPDVFADEAAVLVAFERWIRGAGREGWAPTLVANAGDPGVARLLGRLADWSGHLVEYRLNTRPARPYQPHHTALGPTRQLAGELVEEGGWELRFRWTGAAEAAQAPEVADTAEAQVVLPLPGRHNAENALAVAATALLLGVSVQDIGRHLGSYRGVGRRLEVKGEVDGITVLDDYAHHPTAIRATMSAVRERFPGRRLWAVYEPLTYHRTAAMLQSFADVLADADVALVAEIWAGRDPDTTITSAEALAQAIEARGRASAVAPGSVEKTADQLHTRVRPGDVVLVMGGGRSYVIAERLVALLRGEDLAAG
ncbi:UDP-N-acetylmuramate--L-alanine ligase [soil metagenome]